MSDRKIEFELVRNFIDGDESAFNRIAALYRERIYWHARRMTGNHPDADEVVQEVLIVLYKKLKYFKFQSSLYTWIYRIVTTRSLNYLKKRNLRHLFSLEDNETALKKSSVDIIKNIEAKETFEKLERILQKLPSKQREVFSLRHFDELSYEEIAEITGKSIGGLKANYFHAMKKVTEMMEK